jgi:glycosyltransferase involved in cell wall biosynthesis
MKSKRIAYLINQYPMISHSFIRTEIQELEREGFDVCRTSLRGWDAELVDPADFREREKTQYVLKHGLLPLLMPTARMAFHRPYRIMLALALALRMAHHGDRGILYHLVYLIEACFVSEMVERAGVTHLHAHFGSNAAEVAMLSRTLGGVSYSFTAHGPEEFDKPMQLKLREKIKRASFVVAISSFGKSQLYRYSEVLDWRKIHIVHCGLDESFLSTPTVEAPEVARLVCIGRLSTQKGHLVLVKACEILAQRGVNPEVLLIGDGEMRLEIEAAVMAAGLQESISIMGWRNANEIRKLLIESRGLVLPSFAEGLPVVIMEAMSVGRPVISTYVGGIPELVRHERDGFLVFAGHAEGLADAMERLLRLDRQALARMGASARRRVAHRHSAAFEVPKLASLIESSVEAARVSRC